jgi:hypothetical protein
MTADEITGWVDTLLAAADAEERGRQARMDDACVFVQEVTQLWGRKLRRET